MAPMTRLNTAQCQCESCRYGREVEAHLKRRYVPNADIRRFFRDLYERLVQAETDRDRLRAIIEGNWPSADEIIKRARGE